MLSFFGWGSSPKNGSNGSPSSEESSSNGDQSPSSPTQFPPQPPPTQLANQPPQSNLNLKLLFGGMTFFAISLMITRRSLARKRLASIPPFYTGSIYHQPQVNGGVEAFEALNLATINVLSFGMMTTGAVLYSFNINELEDMRKIVRGGLESGGSGTKTDEELEREVSEWVVSVLGDRFEKQLEKEKMKKQVWESGKTDENDKAN
ncbi:hypothetical protein NUU61_000597 [Penicillium alfredii]|uniref:Altered inheritance of mitochondria protein 11 n=1 Tax=Penicillium alfredii TaxID=1506179 RepID=A0A9W9KR80_9EURO|nr:uncharacterized protein NUU61_000597 [Penicillium alfredii]KAJ5114838.1 hypothetical protein NUU61_000597 [Penicillium alfredii]